MKNLRYLLLSSLVVLVDQITKYAVRISIDPFETIEVLPFLHLVSVRNKGAAFGLFSGLGNTAFIAISAVAIIVVSLLLVKSGEDRLGLSLILGGAIGNLIDRVAFGMVTDFIDFFVGGFHWPAFNVADAGLTIGLVLMLAHSVFPSGKRKKAQ